MLSMDELVAKLKEPDEVISEGDNYAISGNMLLIEGIDDGSTYKDELCIIIREDHYHVKVKSPKSKHWETEA